MVAGYSARKPPRRHDKGWLEAQVAIVEAGMMTMDQALLPHLPAPGGRTFYSALVDDRLPLPRHDG